MNYKFKIKFDIFSPLSFLIPLCVYLSTSPYYVVSYGDSAEMIMSAYKFQSAHPPGYPLFIILGKLFTLIPVGSIAYRLSIMSSIIGALISYFIYKILNILLLQTSDMPADTASNAVSGKSDLSTPGVKAASTRISHTSYFILHTSYKILPLLGSLIIAFFYPLWLYSIVPEVHILNNLLAAMIIYLTIQPSKDGKLQNRLFPFLSHIPYTIYHIPFIFFLFGLGLSNHLNIILLLPPVIFFLYINNRLFPKSSPTGTSPYIQFTIYNILLPLFLGLIPYILIFIFSYLPHYPMYGNTPGLSRFLEYIGRVDYGGLLSGGYKEPIIGNESRIGTYLYFWKIIFKGYLYLPLIGAGFFLHKHFPNYKTKEGFLSYCTIIVAILFPFFSLYGLPASDLHIRAVIEHFSLTEFMLIGIVSVIGTTQLINTLMTKTHKLKQEVPVFSGFIPVISGVLKSLPAVFFLVLVLILVLTNYPRINKRNFSLVHNFAKNMLDQVNDSSIIFASDDINAFSLIYLTQVEKIKPDVKIVSNGFLDNIYYQQELKKSWPDLFETDSIYSYDIARDIIAKNSEKGVYFATFDDPYPLGFLGNPHLLNPQGMLIKADGKTTLDDMKKDSNINYWEKYNYEAYADCKNHTGCGIQISRSGVNTVVSNLIEPFTQLIVHNYYFKAKINSQVYSNAGCRECAMRQINHASEYIGNKEQLLKDLESVKKEDIGDDANAQSLLNLAKNRFASGNINVSDFHRIAWDLAKAEKLEPGNEQILGGLGEIYEMLGLYDYAQAMYQKAAQINPYGGWEGSVQRVRKEKGKFRIGKFF